MSLVATLPCELQTDSKLAGDADNAQIHEQSNTKCLKNSSGPIYWTGGGINIRGLRNSSAILATLNIF